EVGQNDRVVVIGSTLRKDHPLLAHRLRQAAKRGTHVSLVNPVDDDLLMPVAHKVIARPSALADALAQVVKAAAEAKSVAVPQAASGATVSDAARALAGSLASGQKVAVLLGNLAQHHPQAAQLHALAQALAEITGSRLGFLGEAANSVGGYIVNAVPFGAVAGKNAGQMLSAGAALKAYLLLGVEAELDAYDPQQAVAALKQAELVVALSAYQHKAVEYANVLLPIGPFTETAGTFINTEGTVQSFNGVVQPLGEARPAWKVLRVLGNLLGLGGFEQDSADDVTREALGDGNIAARLGNRISVAASAPAPAGTGLERIGEVPIYSADAIVRRSPPLQMTRDAAPPVAWMNRSTAQTLGLRDGDFVRVRQGNGAAVVAYAVDDRVPANCIRLAAARPETAELGPMFGAVSAERVAAEQKVAV
ncbi:MAG TPA: molybdopterin-dependent oxidoreductase, partial [Burkholderiales bacterium]|nr:molybdopterin-dependent oxidoreductase [Burkholderiales bacterium]